jgi:hypothetical protein
MKRTAKPASRARRSPTTTRRKAARTAVRATPRRAGAKPAARRATRRGSAFAFAATLAERGPTGLWPHVFLPREASAFLGRRGAVNVIFGANGVRFRRTAKPDGHGGHFVLFNALMRERSGIEPGDRFDAAIERDTAPRAVEVPRDLQQSLRDDPAAGRAFKAMPPSHRRGYIEFIKEATRQETRVRRIQQALRMMAEWAKGRAAAPKRGSRRG